MTIYVLEIKLVYRFQCIKFFFFYVFVFYLESVGYSFIRNKFSKLTKLKIIIPRSFFKDIEEVIRNNYHRYFTDKGKSEFGHALYRPTVMSVLYSNLVQIGGQGWWLASIWPPSGRKRWIAPQRPEPICPLAKDNQSHGIPNHGRHKAGPTFPTLSHPCADRNPSCRHVPGVWYSQNKMADRRARSGQQTQNICITFE